MHIECFVSAEEAEGLHAKLDGEDRGRGIRDAYTQLWEVVRLPAVRKLALVLLAFRLAVLPAEQAAPLKLLEKGVSKEALAGLVCHSASDHTASGISFVLLNVLDPVQACLVWLACGWTTAPQLSMWSDSCANIDTCTSICCIMHLTDVT